MNDIMTILAIIGALYLGATLAVVAFFIACKKLKDREDAMDAHEQQAVDLVQDEMGGTILSYEPR